MLAKSLVGLVLFVPVLALDYRRIREWLRPAPILVFLAIALPWHFLCWKANGWEFIKVLFIEHQFGRFGSPALLHSQPGWYYLPVLPMLLFPWFPLAIWPAPLALRDWRTRQVMIPLVVLIFGFVFFSLSVNKLATYLLPLLPAACILLGMGMARAPRPERALILPLALLGILPAAGQALPAAIAAGIHTVSVSLPRIVLLVRGHRRHHIAVLDLLQKGRRPRRIYRYGGRFSLALKYSRSPRSTPQPARGPLWLAQHPQCAADVDRRHAVRSDFLRGASAATL